MLLILDQFWIYPSPNQKHKVNIIYQFNLSLMLFLATNLPVLNVNAKSYSIPHKMFAVQKVKRYGMENGI